MRESRNFRPGGGGGGSKCQSKTLFLASFDLRSSIALTFSIATQLTGKKTSDHLFLENYIVQLCSRGMFKCKFLYRNL